MVAGACGALAERGHDVHVAGNAPAAAGAISHVRAHPWPPRRSKVSQLPRLLRLLREIAPEVVHFHSAQPHGAVIVPLLALGRVGLAPRPVVAVTPHTATHPHFPKRLSRAALRRADRVIVPSRWGAEAVRAAGAPADRVVVIENGVDVPARVDDARRRPVVLSLSSLTRRKGLDVLIEAFGHIAADLPDWMLVVAGEGPERSALEARVRQLGLTPRVRFAGHVSGDAKRCLLEGASIGVLASRADNLPGAIQEFQANGVASVATAVGGVAELAGDGALLRLVPPDDARALASALRELMANAPLRDRLARAAREASREREWPLVAERLEAVYRDAIGALPRSASVRA